jgi:p-cymene methyl-monooxygenase electron transfer component
MSFLKRLFGGSSRTVELRPSGVSFQTEAGRTVLETALGQGIAFPHDCTVGTCGSCRARLCDGRVEAITPFGYTLSKEELVEGYILACQAIAKTDLVLEVDVTTDSALPVVRQSASIERTEMLTHDIMRVTFRLEAPLRWRAGQYCNVRWDDMSDHRSYSFAHAPERDGSLRVSTFIRHVPGGAFTDLLFGEGLSSASLELDGPHGNFWLREGNGPILCVAGGSGLAPLISLLQDAAVRRVRRDCILMFGARARRDLYASPEIESIRELWTASFDFWPVLSEELIDGLRHGLVTDFVPEALAKLGEGAQAYMCGPPGMIDAGVSALTARGTPLSDIHYDKFTDASTRA